MPQSQLRTVPVDSIEACPFVGADSAGIDHDVDQFRRVANACAWAEELMYRLAAATGRGGRRHRGAGNGYRWCGPMQSGQFEQAQRLSELASRSIRSLDRIEFLSLDLGLKETRDA
jgi:hypothetical protein